MKPATVAELIEFLTPAGLETACGVSVQAISNAKARGAIPPRHWPAVIELARQKGLKDFGLEDLTALHRVPRQQKLAAEPRAVRA